MEPIFIILATLVGLPTLVFIFLIILTKKAKPIAEQKYEALTQEEIALKAKESISGSFILSSYFSKTKLANLMLINICKEQVNKGD